MIRAIQLLTAVVVLSISLAPSAGAQSGPGPFSYFPTGDVTDGRMLSFGCSAIATFETTVSISLALSPDVPTFTVSFFDGDTGSGGAGAHWDLGTRQMVYRLYFDPLANGNTNPADLVAQWFGNTANPLSNPDPNPEKAWTADAANMPDNGWWNATVVNSALAEAPSGNRFYHLTIEPDGNCITGETLASDLKVGTSAPMTFVVGRFGFEASLRATANDAPIIYPGWPPTGPMWFLDAETTYDGTFEFFLNLDDNQVELEIFDGDFDVGAVNVVGAPSGVPLDSCADTDDADTPADYSGFPSDFTSAGAAPEGVNTPGFPPDDNILDIFRRGEPGDPNKRGCVTYEVRDPLGNVYKNPNPSGNLEWEQFRIATSNATDPNNADYGPAVAADGASFVTSDFLPRGLWTVRLIGLDMANLNFWLMEDVCSVRDGQAACNPPVYLVGDTVFLDKNANGVQDAGEPGIPGVVVNLMGGPGGMVLRTAVTGDDSSPDWPYCEANNTGNDTAGLYCFGTDEPGTYTVEIAASNFEVGGALAGYTNTTGGAEQTGDVATDNLLTLDFGYLAPPGSIGDRVWLDLDGDGVEDAGEPGLEGVQVDLFDQDFNPVASTLTGADGFYLFEDLQPGDYLVFVDEFTLPQRVEPTYDFDGIDSAYTAEVSLGAGESNLDVDFGFQGPGSIGDLVWLDSDGDGTFDGGEAGIGGVAVNLTGAGADGALDTADDLVFVPQVTDAGGGYLFTGLPAGDYRVDVDESTLPAGVALTTGNEPLTVRVGFPELGFPNAFLDADFGYAEPVVGGGSIGDRVWLDVDADGVQDGGEPGINSVRVVLLDAGGTQIASTLTAGDGGYVFTDLDAGTYTVVVDDSTLPTSLVATYDLDGTATPNRAVVVLGPGQARTDVDFGYTGDLVWCAEAANNDQYGAAADHALWLPGISEHFDFQPAGRFVEHPNGTATLLGTAVDRADSTKRFQVQVTFGGRTNTPPAGSPKKELAAAAYVENGGPVNAATWRYYTSFSGTLTGAGSYQGAVLSVVRVGPAFQVGYGANGKNVHFGASGWFNWTVQSQPSSGPHLPSTGQGDFNIDLDTDCLPGGTCLADLDFEKDAAGNTLHKGRIIDDEFAALGIRVTTNDPSRYPAMIFDSAQPTGGDWDLGTPNQAFGGPGIGSGGGPGQAGENSQAHGKVLIITEDRDSNDPDDKASGGTLIFTFDVAVKVESLTILDVDDTTGSTVKTFDAAGTLLTSTGIPTRGDNSVQEVFVGADGVSRLEVRFTGSGAIARIRFCPPPDTGGGECMPATVRDDFDTASYSKNDGTRNWSGPWQESDPAGGGASSGRVRIANGYLYLDDNPDSGSQPSASRQADLSDADGATLTFAFRTGSGVDSDDAVKVEISSNGGASWSTLEVFTGINGTVEGTRSYDVSNWVSDQTRIRFRVTNLYGAADEYFKVKWVEIATTCPGALGSIGDTVWNDGNGNGIQEDPASGLAGVKVKLRDAGGNLLATDTTDSAGHYLFEGLPAGMYKVQVDTSTLPSGLRNPTHDLDGVGTPHEAVVHLDAGEDEDAADFGYNGNSAPCSNCHHFEGWLDGRGDYDLQPNGDYYWSSSGVQEGWLEGPSSANFDLYLYRWNGQAWAMVARDDGSGSSESIRYNGSSGYYVWAIRSESGSGSYHFWYDKP